MIYSPAIKKLPPTGTITPTWALASPPILPPALLRLGVLAGAWTLQGRASNPDGEISGSMTCEWLDGGFFLVQQIDINFAGRAIRGIEIIGYDPACQMCISHIYGDSGKAFKYVWEASESTLTIWGGWQGTPAAFQGKFSRDRSTITGRWEWPGGGCDATLTKSSLSPG